MKTTNRAFETVEAHVKRSMPELAAGVEDPEGLRTMVVTGFQNPRREARLPSGERLAGRFFGTVDGKPASVEALIRFDAGGLRCRLAKGAVK